MTADQTIVYNITGDLRALGAHMRRLREAGASDLGDIALQVGIDPVRLAALEAGDADLTVRELAMLAHVLEVVLQIGFRPTTTIHDLGEIPVGMTEEEEDAFWGTHTLS